MTEEQIKQNAHDYTYTNDHNWTWDNSGESRVDISAEILDAHIAGAHSRDEEIVKLKGRIERLRAILTVSDLNKEVLRNELDKLRNPWISVEERLPDDNQVVLAHHEIIIDGGGEHKEDENVTIQRYVGKWITNRMEQQRMGKWLFDITDRVTHWMPILELKKGE